MKRLALTFVFLLGLVGLMCAGPEPISGKEMKQVAPAPCSEWYADNEWNVSLWGTYAFAGESWDEDRYIESDHAWGGGADLKYFFHRYFGVGIEGWVINARRALIAPNDRDDLERDDLVHESRAVGAVLGTFTLRYPFHCSRFSPYVWVGGGAIFGGGEREVLIPNLNGTFDISEVSGAVIPQGTVIETDPTTEFVGQFGAGFEVRFTRHIGWTNDFSWNVVNGSRNNFGMVRSGINFAF